MAQVTIHSTNLENIALGSLQTKWSARGDRILRYYIDVRHKKLNLHKEVGAPEIFILQSKLDALIARFRGQRLTTDSLLDSRLSFGGSVGRADWFEGRRVGDNLGIAAA